MTAATAHPPGVFCWPELVTTDPEAAARFYADLFDWSPQPARLRDATYTLFKAEGLEVGGCRGLGSDEPQGNPRWKSYISVSSADQTAAQVEALGGRVIVPPADLDGLSRIAECADSEGALFSLWEARPHPGARHVNGPGSLCWTELIAVDLGAAEGFYTKLFRWHSRRDRYDQYVEFLRGEDSVAGMLRTPPGRGSAGSHWLPYFAVSDADDAVHVARRHFAKILGRPVDIPLVGRSAVLRDPQGAVFGIFGMNEAA